MVKNKPHKAGPKGITFIEACNDELRLRSLKEVLIHELSGIESSNSYSGNVRSAAHRFKQRCGKRMRIPGNNRANAIDKFIEANELVKSELPRLDQNVISDARDFISHALESFTSRYCSTPQLDLDLELLYSLWRFGPGSNVHHSRSTDFLSKITGRWSVTRAAKPYAKQLVKYTPSLAATYGGQDDRFEIVYGSKGFTVPKNEDIDRFCGSEPLWNMACQIMAGMYLEGALRAVGLDISTQADRNKHLAWIASITGSKATIDLKMASDLISPALVKLLFPSSWYHLLMAVRSPIISIDGIDHEMRMMSTMGNGFTFPMMTLILLSLCYAVADDKRRHYIDYNEWGVFGDDIICPTIHFDRMVEVIESAGLIVNHDKSYCTDNFRESCGGDFDEGYDVTPVYIKSLRSDAEVYVAINQILGWCGKHRVVLPDTLKALYAMLRTNPYLVPEWEADYAGIRVSGVRKRYKRLTAAPKKWLRDVSGLPGRVVTMAAIGGYVNGFFGTGKLDKVMTTVRLPQGTASRYYVESVKMPKGFLTGHDPVKRVSVDSCWIDRLVAVTLQTDPEAGT